MLLLAFRLTELYIFILRASILRVSILRAVMLAQFSAVFFIWGRETLGILGPFDIFFLGIYRSLMSSGILGEIILVHCFASLRDRLSTRARICLQGAGIAVFFSPCFVDEIFFLPRIFLLDIFLRVR